MATLRRIYALDQMTLNYRQLSTTCCLNLASVLLRASGPTSTWKIPFSFLLENLNPLKPRCYSIASAPAVSPRKIALTVTVKQLRLENEPSALGLASRFFLDVQQSLSPKTQTSEDSANRPLWCSLRKSKFKPPVSNLHPIVMIANGSGIAPFLGTLHHSLRKWEIEGGVGKMLLLYGCRDETFHLYKDELGRIQDAFGGQLQLITAYSRKGAGEKANVYICGSVNMACSVREELLGVIQKKEGWTDPQARDFESTQLRMRRWQLDVWG